MQLGRCPSPILLDQPAELPVVLPGGRARGSCALLGGDRSGGSVLVKLIQDSRSWHMELPGCGSSRCATHVQVHNGLTQAWLSRAAPHHTFADDPIFRCTAWFDRLM